MKKYYRFTGLILALFLSCNYSECCYTANELKSNYFNRISLIRKTKTGSIEYRDKGKDTTQRGGYYEFYKNGNLKTYYYFHNIEMYSYREDYESNGKFIKSTGIPYVDKDVKLDSSGKLWVKIYLFSLKTVYGKLSVSTIDEAKMELDLVEDTIYSNMKCAYFMFDCSPFDKKDLRWIFSVKRKNICTNKTDIITDTLSLYYKK